MRFPVEALFQAFQAAGMLVPAVFDPSGQAKAFSVQWVKPEQLLLDDQAQSTEYTIEYETSAVPRIVKGTRVDVDGAAYRARAHAQQQGDGYFSRCHLDKA